MSAVLGLIVIRGAQKGWVCGNTNIVGHDTMHGIPGALHRGFDNASSSRGVFVRSNRRQLCSGSRLTAGSFIQYSRAAGMGIISLIMSRG